VPIIEPAPWRHQFFDHVACPQDLFIPTDDPEAWEWNPRHRWVFDKLVPLSRRITRVYLYHWNAVSGDNWDSGLVDPRGRSRPALRVLRGEQQTLEARARRRAAQQPG